MVECPKCEKILMDTNTDGTRRLRTKILLFEATGAIAVCPQCKERVPVPVTLTGETERTPLKHVILTK